MQVRIFLDTSALFAGIWSAEGGARMILKLGELGTLRIFVSPQVIREIDAALRRKAPDLLGPMAMLLDAANVDVRPEPHEETKCWASSLVTHPGDALILAAAMDVQPDYFVTLDRVHFLNNKRLLEQLPFPVGTPGDFLAWWREHVVAGE